MNTYDFRLPCITASDTAGQVAQLKSYLWQTIEQLNYALNDVDKQIVEQKNTGVRQSAPSQTDRTQAAQNAFEEVKGLIINSADIIQAYYEEMNRQFSSNYVAQSEFGTYQSQVTNDINASAEGIRLDITDREAVLRKDIDSNTSEIYTTKGVIKLGLLETVGGEGIYGMEVGSYSVDEETGEQTMTARYARFTSDRLAFYGASQTEPVAYISNNKLFITNAEITGTLILGGYRIDTNDGLIFRWVGV